MMILFSTDIDKGNCTVTLETTVGLTMMILFSTDIDTVNCPVTLETTVVLTMLIYTVMTLIKSCHSRNYSSSNHVDLYSNGIDKVLAL